MSRVYALFKVGRPFDESNRFQTSWVLSPCVLAAARLSFALYLFSTQVFTLSHDSVHDPIAVRQHWSYFTNISLWSLGFYFLFAGCNGVVYAVSGVAPLQKWPRPFQAAYGIFYSTITVYPILVTMVYWIILAPTDEPFQGAFKTWSAISVHIINSVCCVFEIIVPRTQRLPWIHLPFCILFVALYLGLAYITYATQGFYTYNFLNPKNGVGSLVAYVFGILAAICVIFTAVRWVIQGRVWLTEHKLGFEGKFASNHKGCYHEDTNGSDLPMFTVEYG